jgi:hypothetical protein
LRGEAHDDGSEAALRAWTAGFGGLIGGFLIYAALAGLGGGVDWEDRLTFDQSGELELEGLGIFYGIVLGAALGAPLGAYFALRLTGAARAGRTAVLTFPAAALLTALGLWVVPSGPRDPVIAPFVVFGGWFLAAFLTRWLTAPTFDQTVAQRP